SSTTTVVPVSSATLSTASTSTVVTPTFSQSRPLPTTGFATRRYLARMATSASTSTSTSMSTSTSTPTLQERGDVSSGLPSEDALDESDFLRSPFDEVIEVAPPQGKLFFINLS
ncbi:unnamed protein product, partial [Porites lobata]